MKIFCLVGKSCSGKDTIFKKIIETRKDIIPLITYTTRPKRVYEKNAKEYYFVTKEHFYKMYNNNKVIEHRIYHTEHGDWIYFMVEDGQVEVNTNKKYIVINTLEGAKRLDMLPEDCWYIGDDLRDMQAGHAAGTSAAIAAKWGYCVNPESWPSDFVAADPHQLLELIQTALAD